MKQSLLYLTSLCAVLLLQFGCGGGPTGSSAATNTLETSHSCIQCHETKTSPVTQKLIVSEWTASAHNTSSLNNKSKFGAGCTDCHGSGFLHEGILGQASCAQCHSIGAQAVNPIKNPDAAGMCANCHDSTKGFETARVYDGVSKNTLTEHFSTPTLAAYTSGSFKARYVTKNYEKSCRSCHNPHDNSAAIDTLRQWARSRKGDVNSLAATSRDFRTSGTTAVGATPATSFGTDCVRCHTTTGHLNYLANRSIAPFGTSKTDGKEVLACNLCHTGYDYARRPVGQVTAYYNKSTASKMRVRFSITYPDITESNICLNCHVGRETGQVIKELGNPTLTANKVITPSGPYNFANASFENSHYLTAGATIFKTSGFEFYSSQYYDNPSFYAHDKIGVANFNNTGTSGPCITCHMRPGNHTFLPVVRDSSGNTISLTSTTCNNASCHNGSTSPLMSATEIEHQKTGYNAAMDALKASIQQRLTAVFTNTNPYFFKPNLPFTSANAFKAWGNASTGPNNMGAAFNYNLLYHDFGAFAHNRIYAKRLIYDSISWMYDNDISTVSNVNGFPSDVEAAIQNSSILTAQQKNDACSYLFTSRTYTIYSARDSRNWRPGSSSTSPIY